MITDEMVEAAANAICHYGRPSDLNSCCAEPMGQKRCQRHARASLEAADAAAWQDISTAPKDGTIIDVWLGDAEQADIDFYCPDGSRRSTDWRWQSGKFRPVMGLSIAVTLVQPTHWRRIPEPPHPAGEGET